MLTVEEAFDIAIIEEGQFLLGTEFIVDTLGFNWDKIYKVFVKSVKEYSRRKPLFETKTLYSTDEAGVYKMPEGTVAVNAVRYDILPNYPRFMFPDFGPINFEYEDHNKILRTFPPMQSLRVSYSREYTFSNSANMSMTEFLMGYETEAEMLLNANPKKGTLTISKDGKTMVENGIIWQEVDNGTPEHSKVKMVALKGDLGKAFFNPATRELHLYPKKGTDGDLTVSFFPKYDYVNELTLRNELFLELFKSHLLEAIASLRNQATQAHLHNVDLSTDDLYGRARLLRAQVEKHLRETFDFGATAFI